MDKAVDSGDDSVAGYHPAELLRIGQDDKWYEQKGNSGKINYGKKRHVRYLSVDGETEILTALRLHLEAVDEEVGDQPEQGAQYHDDEA